MSYRYNTIDVAVGVGMCAILFGALLFFAAAGGTYQTTLPQPSPFEQSVGLKSGMAWLQPAMGQAVVEHAGPVAETLLKAIEGAMSQRYHRPVAAVAKPRPDLLAGLRVRVGDDVYESSVAGQLATLSV